MASKFDAEALELHKRYHGKLAVTPTVPLTSRDDLSRAYTPGVAAPCLAIKDDPESIYDYTTKGNMVAVVTNGTAVLGLGNIGAGAGLPVMEGKSILFKGFAGVDSVPVCVNSPKVEDVVKVCQLIAPTYGGINLEDIKAPQCFDIENELKKTLDIPVFHDDQHGTAIVVVSAPGSLTQDMIKTMSPEPVVMAMANPVPEILPDEAKEAGARIVCTGRSDFPNQVNNLLAFPGIFRGALDVRAKEINEEMKIAAAGAIASLIPESELNETNIIASPLDPRVAPTVAAAVAKAAIETGVARRTDVTPEDVAAHTRSLLGQKA